MTPVQKMADLDIISKRCHQNKNLLDHRMNDELIHPISIEFEQRQTHIVGSLTWRAQT